MSKRTLFLIFALFLITAVLLMIALYKPSLKPLPPIQTMIPKEPVEQTSLMFGDTSVAASASKSNLTYSLPVNITTQKNKVTAVQLELQYDPEVLANVVVAPGSFFPKPVVLLNNIDIKTGRISYAFGISPIDQGVMGQGVAAVLNFTAKSSLPKQTSIIFLPKTLVTAEGITQSVVKEMKNAQFTVISVSTTTPKAE